MHVNACMLVYVCNLLMNRYKTNMSVCCIRVLIFQRHYVLLTKHGTMMIPYELVTRIHAHTDNHTHTHTRIHVVCQCACSELVTRIHTNTYIQA